MPLLLTCSKSYSIFYFWRRSRVIFLGSSLTKTNFYCHGRHFLCVSVGCGPTLLPRLVLSSAPGSAPRDIYGALFYHFPPFLFLCQLLPLCSFLLYLQLYFPTTHFLLSFKLLEIGLYAHSWWLWSLLSRLTLITILVLSQGPLMIYFQNLSFLTSLESTKWLTILFFVILSYLCSHDSAFSECFISVFLSANFTSPIHFL